jgi:hypothetical protein
MVEEARVMSVKDCLRTLAICGWTDNPEPGASLNRDELRLSFLASVLSA